MIKIREEINELEKREKEIKSIQNEKQEVKLLFEEDISLTGKIYET